MNDFLDTLTEPEQIAEIDLSKIREHARRSLYFFAKGILGFDWLVPHVHGPVCLALENRARRRKKFVLPRGWLKTTVCSQAYPIWRAVHDSNVRVLLAQNNKDNAIAKLRVIREQFETNQLLRALYPDVLPTKDCTWGASSLCLHRSGTFPESTFECVGVRGQAVSRHYNIIVEDDTVAPDFDELGQETLAPSHDDVRKAIAWHSLALPLLTDPSTDEIIVVGTRWYEHDLMAHIAKNEPQYISIERSCLEDADGNSDPRGMVTYPERFNRDVLAEYETTLGPYFFSTLMLNRPVGVGDMLFRAEWFREYEEIPPRQSLHIYTTIDPATDPELSTSRADDLDYSVVMTCGKDTQTGHIYVLDYFRKRCNPGDLAAAIFDQVYKWQPIVVGYEDVAYQKSLDYWLKELMRQQGIFFVLKPIKRVGRKNKETYIMGLQPIAAAGAIFIRPWMKELITEFLSFPRGAHDDLIDCMSMQTELWRRTKSKAEYRRLEDPNSAFTIETAINELRMRHRTHRDCVIFDPATSLSTVFANRN